MQTPLVFFGSSEYVIPIIDALTNQRWLRLVVTTEKNPLDTIPSFCKKTKIPYLSLQQFTNEAILVIKKIKAPLGILADFGLIIPNSILEIFPKGIINIHPSLLPKYRGPTPVQTALLNGDKTTGITLIKLDDKLDHGAILDQREEKVNNNDTAKSLYERLFVFGKDMLMHALPLYLNDKLVLRQQDHTRATYTKSRLTRQDGYVDIQNPPKKKVLQQMVKAYYPWPGVWSKVKLEEKEVRIKFLPEAKIQIEGKKAVTYKDFVNGHKEAKNILNAIGN